MRLQTACTDIAGRYQLTATKRSSPPNFGTHEAPNGLQPRTPCRFPRVRQIAMYRCNPIDPYPRGPWSRKRVLDCENLGTLGHFCFHSGNPQGPNARQRVYVSFLLRRILCVCMYHIVNKPRYINAYAGEAGCLQCSSRATYAK